MESSLTGRSEPMLLPDRATPPLPWDPGAGIELLDGRVLTFEPHPECPCADCRAADRFGRFEEADDAL